MWHCVPCCASRKKAMVERAAVEKGGGLTPVNGKVLQAFLDIDWVAAAADTTFDRDGVVTFSGRGWDASWCYDMLLPGAGIVMPRFINKHFPTKRTRPLKLKFNGINPLDSSL